MWSSFRQVRYIALSLGNSPGLIASEGVTRYTVTRYDRGEYYGSS
jgi:hypothetical protein